VTSRNPDIVGAAAIAVLALVTIAGGVTTPDPGFGVVSPAVLPTLVGVLMLASAAWLAVDTLRGAPPPATERMDRRPFGYTIAATAAFLFAFVPLGFVISATAFLIAQARILGSRHLLRDSIASLLFIAALYLLFVQGLTITLPKGPLPF
jgi:tripartite tricarboxylate transporter TctB family protein